jgi:acyl transferase domain-containing protein/acyl carrier protein
MKKPNPPIAVVGVSALFPGSVDANGFWRDILAGKDLISDVPPSHWLIDDYYDPNPAAPDKTYAKRGAFLTEVDFDPVAFGVPPSAVPATDTSQLLALIVAQKVLEDACLGDFQKLDRSRTSVILGVTSAQELLASMVSRLQRPVWVKALRESGVPEEEVGPICDRIAANYVPWQESSFPGLLGNVVAGRIANRFDLGGTNCVTDAACASTFSAVSMAVNELYLGQSDLVITGGVDTLNDIFMFMCFSKTPALSQKGDCRPFSDAADGTMLGEGLGMLALRRLEDAERDGNPIYAVLRSVGAGSDGRAKSVYAPLPAGQARAITRAYEGAGYGPETVELVEAHGTATKAGDAAEFEGLKLVFDDKSQERQWCALGSVKSQIGHTKAAAGAAGLFKAVMALQHGILPPTIKVDRPNPKLEIEKSPFYLNTKARPWVRGADHPRRASVSSFGFGGSNFHLALEEYSGPSAAPRQNFRSHELVTLSGASMGALAQSAQAFLGELKVQASLQWAAQESQRRFDVKAPHRLAIVAADLAGLSADLSKAATSLAQGTAPSSATVHYGSGEPGPVAFLFPGQGSQSVGMGGELAMNFREALSVWDRAASLGLHDKVFPRPVFDEAAAKAQDAELRRTEWAQPAIGATSASMLAVLKRLGLEAQMAAGHSFGELTALYAAGVWSEADFLKVSQKRGALMAEAAAIPGAMSAVSASKEEVEAVLRELGGAAVVANHNAPKQVVISGPTEAVAAAEQALKAKKLSSTRLPVATAFHSPVVAGSVPAFAEFLRSVPNQAPRYSVYSNGTAAPHGAEVMARLASQIGEPVRFVEEVLAMHQAGARIFVEVGPGSVLTGLTGRILEGQAHQALALDDKKGGVYGLMVALAKLSALGVPLVLSALFDGVAVEDPKKKLKPKMAMPINGSNYARPYPPPGGVAALPKPNPPRALPDPVVVVKEVPVAVRDGNGFGHGNGHAHDHDHDHGNGVAVGRGAGGPSGEWLRVFEETQRSTAEAHLVFQRTMADAHRTFLSSMTQSLESAPQAAPLMSPAFLPAPAVNDSALGLALPAPAMPRAPAPVAPVAPVMAKAPAAPVAPVPVAPAPVPVTPAKVAAPATAQVDLRGLLFAVVAEKTGYPVEALGPAMDLEGDLGIDSIKRVEILSTLRERAPGLPDVAAEQLGKLRTMEQILGFLGTAAPALAVGAPVAVSAQPAAAPKASGLDLEQILKEVVAEKTGYPVEALRAELDLEGDLGIDSIKRVEILSRLRERAPGLPDVPMEGLAKLRTLGQISEQLGGAGGVVPAAAASATAAAPGLDLEQILKEVVAEKTGYPVEALRAELDLEGDLGIDSIKRVEILSRLRERAPGLPDVPMEGLAKLRTLGQISEQLGGGPSGATVATAPASVPAAGLDLEQILKEVVAEKTGYPVEALRAELDLEGDLGIDSIKRVEILSRLRERAPGLPDVPMEGLAKLRTLGQISEQLGGAPTAKAPTPVAEVVAAPKLSHLPPLGRWVVQSLEAPALGLLSPRLPRAQRVTVTDDGAGVQAALIAELKRHGVRAEADRGTLDGEVVIDLGGLTADPKPVVAIMQASLQRAQAFAKAGLKDRAYYLVVDGGGTLGVRGTDPARAPLGGLLGLAKTAALEWPEVQVRGLDVARGGRDASQLAEAIAAELMFGGPEVEIGLDAQGHRTRLSSVPTATGAGPAQPKVGADSVWVVSGGGRGVTRAIVLGLAKRYRGRYVLLGRTPLVEETPAQQQAKDERALLGLLAKERPGTPPLELKKAAAQLVAAREIRETMAALSVLGASARYEATDVRDPAAVARTLDGVRSAWGPIHGLIHAAGVIEDRLIADKTAAQADRVLGTKIDGLQALLQATAHDPLSVMALFGSISGRTGNIGQSDYAMANEALVKVARVEAARRGPSCVVKVMAWGPWKGGMVTPSHEKIFEERGVPLIDLDSGARLFLEELEKPDAVEVVLGCSPNAHDPLVVPILVSPETHGYLSGHRIKGVPVVPVVLALEWFVRVARLAQPELRLAKLSHLKVLRGARLEHFERGQGFTVHCRTLANGGPEATLGLELRGEKGELHYAAEASMAQKQGGPTLSTVAPKVEGWTGDVYGGVLFHGPSFQAIQSLRGVSAEGGEATLRGLGALGWPVDDWRTDSGVLDGGLQLALLWSEKVLGRPSLPTSIASARIYTTAPHHGEIRCLLRGVETHRERTRADLVFLAADGQVVAELEGVETHALPGEA